MRAISVREQSDASGDRPSATIGASGGALPVLMRSLGPRTEQFGGIGGRLYAANTTGAISGALLTSFVFIPVLGVRGSALAPARSTSPQPLPLLRSPAACAVQATPRKIRRSRPARPVFASR
jgi:hypothetical protein